MCVIINVNAYLCKYEDPSDKYEEQFSKYKEPSRKYEVSEQI